MKIYSLILSLFICLPALANDFDFTKLKVAKDIKPGLWNSSFTFTPKHPQLKDRSTQACATQKDLMNSLNTTAQRGENSCKIEVKKDADTTAELVMRCPPIEIPQAKMKIPGQDIPIKIVKESANLWTVTVNMPAVPGAVPKSVWKHTYSRAGECKR